MPITFINGSDITLAESLKFADRGSRSPHPGGGNNMTTILMQLGIPTVLFWEVKAGLSGYEVSKLAAESISRDHEICGPWAQFYPLLWDNALLNLPENLAKEFRQFKTPYQMHLAIARKAFPGVVKSSAEFYLGQIDIVEKALRILADSRFAGHFSKKLYPGGHLVTSRNFYGDVVEYDDGSYLKQTELADGYLRLMELVRQSEVNLDVNPADYGVWGVLPDARIMSVLDTLIFAHTAGADRVYAWSGVAMFQYILGSADSQRWREITSQMYDLVRRKAFPNLPEDVEFVLIPTQGLGQLALTDQTQADLINGYLEILRTPPEHTSSYLAEGLRNAVSGKTREEILAYLSAQTPESTYFRLKSMIDEGNATGACGVVAHYLQEKWRKENRQDIDSAKKNLVQALQNGNGRFILHNQPTVTPLEILMGERLYLLHGVLDTPTGKLEVLRLRYQQMVEGKKPKNTKPGSMMAYSHAGWDW